MWFCSEKGKSTWKIYREIEANWNQICEKSTSKQYVGYWMAMRVLSLCPLCNIRFPWKLQLVKETSDGEILKNLRYDGDHKEGLCPFLRDSKLILFSVLNLIF